MRVKSNGAVDADGAFNSSAFDVAESYPTMDAGIEPGTVVALDTTQTSIATHLVTSTTADNKDKVLGVISTDPGFHLGGTSFESEFCSEVKADEEAARTKLIQKETYRANIDSPEATQSGTLTEQTDIQLSDSMLQTIDNRINACKAVKQVPIALSGRVPVKVDQTNGAIKAGDLLTVSTATTGHAMKAVENGWVIGRALEDQKEGSNLVMTFIMITWYNGEAQSLADSMDESVEATDLSGINVNGKALFADDVNVLGKTTLSDVTVTGILSTGLLKIDGIANSINAIGTDLKLQDSALAENIDIFNGRVTMTTNGDIKTVGEITAKKYNVDTSDVAGASAGSTVIPTGEEFILVETTALTSDSLIFVTPNKALPIGSWRYDEATFVIELDAPATEDIEVNWWIVN